MTIEQMIKRCNQYKEFLENGNNLKFFRKIYDMEFKDLVIFILQCESVIRNNLKLSRDERVFLNEMERCYQRVLKNEVKS